MYVHAHVCACVNVRVSMIMKCSDECHTHHRNNCPLPARSEDMESF